MPTVIQHDKQPEDRGKTSAFQARITPESKEQFEVAARDVGVSLVNWMKTLGYKELQRLGIELKT